jgi:hypothetical protein
MLASLDSLPPLILLFQVDQARVQYKNKIWFQIHKRCPLGGVTYAHDAPDFRVYQRGDK